MVLALLWHYALATDQAVTAAGWTKRNSHASRLDHSFGLQAVVSIELVGLSNAAASERNQPRRPTRLRLPVRPGDAALRRRRHDGRHPPLATKSGVASTRAAASPAPP